MARYTDQHGEIKNAGRAERFVQGPTEVWRQVLTYKVFTAGELMVLQTMSQ